MRLFLLPLMLAVVATPMAALAQRVTPPMMGLAGGASAGEAGETAEASVREGIVAVVNDGIVTTADLRGRMALSLLSAGLPNRAEIRERLLPQVLRSLIDDQLQLQKASSLGLSVSEAEIESAIQRLAVENKIPGGDMAAFLATQGVPPSALRAQVKAGVLWSKVIQREIRPRIDIGDDEIDAAIHRMRANAGKQEYLVSEIYLAVDNPKEEDRIQALAQDLVQQLKNGAVFGSVARQFSQGTGAVTGGDMGWVQLGQLSPEIDAVLTTLDPSEVSMPIRTANGYHILGMRDKRRITLGATGDVTVQLKQAFHPLSDTGDKERMLAEAVQMRQRIRSCAEMSSRMATDYAAWRVQDLGEINLSEAPAWLADKVSTMAEGEVSEPMEVDKGTVVLFVCSKSVPDNVNRQEIMNAIGLERMELAARRLMRDLKRQAHIDVRMKS